MEYTFFVGLGQYVCIDLVAKISFRKALFICIKVTKNEGFAHTLLQLPEGFFALERSLKQHFFPCQSVQRPCNPQKFQYTTLIEVAKAYKGLYIFDLDRLILVLDSFDLSRVYLDTICTNYQVQILCLCHMKLALIHFSLDLKFSKLGQH